MPNVEVRRGRCAGTLYRACKTKKRAPIRREAATATRLATRGQLISRLSNPVRLRRLSPTSVRSSCLRVAGFSFLAERPRGERVLLRKCAVGSITGSQENHTDADDVFLEIFMTQ